MNADPVALLLSIPGVGPYTPYIMFAIAVCSAAVRFVMPVPTTTSRKWYAALYNIVHTVAMNKSDTKVLAP